MILHCTVRIFLVIKFQANTRKGGYLETRSCKQFPRVPIAFLGSRAAVVYKCTM